MEIEHKVVCLPIDEKQMEILQGLEKEGYQLVPGVTPVAVYHLVRAKPAVVSEPAGPVSEPSTSGGPQFKFTIDDSKIFVKKPN